MKTASIPTFIVSSIILAAALSFMPVPAYAGTASDGNAELATALTWGLIPGGGHFYLGENETGAAYAGTMLSLLGAGTWLDERNSKLQRDDEVNAFWLIALKEWELSLFTTYRSALRSQVSSTRSRAVDDTPVEDLFAAPFQKRYCSEPMVILAGVLGIAAAAYDSRNAEHSWGQVDRVGILGMDADRPWGSGLYGVDALCLSLAAGVSEEAVWRGLVQNELELTFGQRWGLWSTATLFGAAHVVDLDGRVRGERMLVATVAGLYLGHLYQQTNHRLGPPIAAHFWYNFAAMLTSFALDPENNILGAKVSFRF